MPFGIDDAAMMMGGGMLLQGGGGILSALNPPQGPAQIDPQIQAELQARGVDISAYLASLQGANQMFNQNLGQYGAQLQQFGGAMSQYPAQYQAALQNAYNSRYGGIENSMRGYAQDIMAGKTSPFTENLLAREGVTTGQDMNQALSNAKQQLASLNIDPSSPAYTDMLRQTMNDVSKRGLEAQSNIMTQFQNPMIAQGILQNAQNSNRLSGMAVPRLPTVPTAPNLFQGIQMPGQQGSGQAQTRTSTSPNLFSALQNAWGQAKSSNFGTSPGYGPGYSFQGFPQMTNVRQWNGMMPQEGQQSALGRFADSGISWKDALPFYGPTHAAVSGIKKIGDALKFW